MTTLKKARELLYCGAILLLAVNGCGNRNNSYGIPDRNSIVLIVDSFPTNRQFTYLSGGVVAMPDSLFMMYIDDDLNVKKIHLKNSGCDTILIPSKRAYVEVKYLYNINPRYALLATGDTVLIRYNSLQEPVFISMRNKHLSNLYNFYTSVTDKRFNYGLLAPESATSIPVTIAQTIKNRMDEEEFQQSPLALEYIAPDTLQKALNEFFNAYREKMDSSVADTEYREWLEYQLSRNTNLLNDSIELQPVSDSYIEYISYQQSLERYYQLYGISKKIPSPTMINDVYTHPQGHRSHRMMYDTLRCDRTLPPKTKSALLRHAVELMNKENYPDYEECKRDYFSAYGMPDLCDPAENIRNIDFRSLKLIDTEGETWTLEAVLDANRGRIVYIDFWATVCTPCIQSMPAAVELRRKFEGKDIAFVYISTWDREEVWCKKWRSIIGDKINYQSYLTVNYKDSELIRALNISIIPRYLLFDRQGKLIDDHAPGPQNPNLVNTLQFLLKTQEP